MDWVTFLSNLIDSLAWPSVVVVAVILLRRPLAGLLPLLRHAKYKDLEFHFGQKLDELERRADDADIPETAERPAWVYESPDEWTFGDYIERLAIVSPRVAISEAWRHVELALRGSAERLGKPLPRHVVGVARLLRSEGWLPRDAVGLLEDLRVLRNQAVHARDFDLDTEQAIEFSKLAERLIATIQVETHRQPNDEHTETG